MTPREPRHFAERIGLDGEERLPLRFAFDVAGIDRVEHLLPDPAIVDALAGRAPAAAGKVSASDRRVG